MRIGVRLARLHPDCERLAYEPWLLASLTRSEADALLDVSRAAATSEPEPEDSPGPADDENVVQLRPG